MMANELIRFLLAGAAGVNFLSRIALSLWLPYAAAIIVASVLGMATAFIINRAFVFREATNELYHQMLWFTVVNLTAVLQTLLASLVLADVLFPRTGFHWHKETIAHAVGIVVPVVTSYVGHKHLSFRRRT